MKMPTSSRCKNNMAACIYQAIYFTSNVSYIPDAAVDEVIDDIR